MEKFEETTFDAITYTQILSNHALQFISYKIFKMYGFLETFHIPVDKLVNFTKDL